MPQDVSVLPIMTPLEAYEFGRELGARIAASVPPGHLSDLVKTYVAEPYGNYATYEPIKLGFLAGYKQRRLGPLGIFQGNASAGRARATDRKNKKRRSEEVDEDDP